MKKVYADQLRDLGVATVFLFGSQGSGTASPLSDTDIGVLMKIHPADAGNPGGSHLLYEQFSDLFPGSSVDIVVLQTAPLEGKLDEEIDQTVGHVDDFLNGLLGLVVPRQKVQLLFEKYLYFLKNDYNYLFCKKSITSLEEFKKRGMIKCQSVSSV